MRRRLVISESGNVCMKKTNEPMECPTTQRTMQGDKMPPCRVNCSLFSVYKQTDDYNPRVTGHKYTYVAMCGDDRVGCVEKEDIVDSMRSSISISDDTEQDEERPTIMEAAIGGVAQPIERPRRAFTIIDEPAREEL